MTAVSDGRSSRDAEDRLLLGRSQPAPVVDIRMARPVVDQPEAHHRQVAPGCAVSFEES